LIIYLDENGRVKVIELDASAVGWNVRIYAKSVGGDCNHRRWRFPPEIVVPEP
jgi:hypothetical protein